MRSRRTTAERLGFYVTGFMNITRYCLSPFPAVVAQLRRSAMLGAHELAVIRTEGNEGNEEEFGASFPSFASVASVAVGSSAETLFSGTRLSLVHPRLLPGCMEAPNQRVD